MPADTKKAIVTSDILRLLSAGMEAALVKPKETTSDELCTQQYETNKQPNAFRKRLVKRRRALGQDDGVVSQSGSGEGNGAGAAAKPRAKRSR